MDRSLYQNGGGLGDWLLNTTLPELFSKQGDDVYLSSDCKFNNQGTLDLLLCCPYIKGFTEIETNIGCKGDQQTIVLRDSDDYGLIGWDGGENVTIVYVREYSHNFNPKNTKPIIYYQPKFRKEFMNKVVVDFNSSDHIFYGFDYDQIKKFISNNLDYVYLNIKDEFSVDGVVGYQTKDIFEYIDILYSSKKFICLMSGGNTLISAISRFRVKLDVDVYLPDKWDISRPWEWTYFKFPNSNFVHF